MEKKYLTIDEMYNSYSSRKLFSEAKLKTSYAGDITYKKMKDAGLCNDEYNEENGYIYPFMDSSTMNNHIKGYCKLFNFDGKGIKVCESGDAGKSIYIEGKYFIGRPAYVLTNDLFANEYFSSVLNNIIPKYKQTSVVSNVMYEQIKDVKIEIPEKHEELARVIKRVLEYKQLSKQLSKQMEKYKLAILQESEKSIKHWKENGEKDKFISFNIGDEFELNLGWDKRHWGKSENEYLKYGLSNAVDINLGGYNPMKDIGLCNDISDNIYKFPFYDNSTQNNHIKGFSRIYNYETRALKINLRGSVGRTKLIEGKIFLGQSSLLAESKKFVNSYVELLFDKKLVNYSQGSTVLALDKKYIKDIMIDIPYNHITLSRIIQNINNQQTIINNTTVKMESYIEQVLKLSLSWNN